jgi:hypothetical protein
MSQDSSKKRNQKKSLYLFSISIFIGCFLFVVIPSQSAEEIEKTKIDEILEKSAEYCEKLENSSLDFTCVEEIKERIYYQQQFTMSHFRPTSFFYQNSYVYDYQLIRKENKITERRVLIEENGKKKNEKDAELKTVFFDHKYVILGPVGLLSKNSQQDHDYKIIGEEMLKKEKVIVIEAIPKSNPVEISAHLFGKIWIKKDDFSILKIEWNQVSMGNFEKILEKAKSFNAEPQITFVSEYAFEKNGVRFPSKYYVLEEYIRPSRAKLTASETTVIYKDYKFFTVETEVKYK